jgi:hypothetical protein
MKALYYYIHAVHPHKAKNFFNILVCNTEGETEKELEKDPGSDSI